MARYTGPKTKISRIFGEPILGNGKWLSKNSNPPGQHGATRKRKAPSEYAIQLKEKQKAKYTYGLLEKQFRKTYDEASRKTGVKGENLIKLLEARLDNTVFRMGIAPSRPAARQLVSHKHILVNGEVVNVPSFQLKPGDVVTVEVQANAFLHHMVRNIVGSLLPVGRGEQPEEWLGDLLAGRDRTLAGPTAPSAGLVFLGPRYPAQWGLPAEVEL